MHPNWSTALIRHLFLTLCLSISTPTATLADDVLDALDRPDEVRSWRAVGKLEIGGMGSCTATLIDTDLVLTAAHCLVSEDGTPHDPDDIMFRAAFQNGRQAAAVRAETFVVPDAYDPNGHRLTNGFAVDVGLIRLVRDVPSTQIAPFSPAQGVSRREELTVVSYGQGRNDAPSLQRRCNQLSQEQGLIVMDCDATFGSSGAPVFVMRAGRPQIAGVLAGGFNNPNGFLTVAVPLSEHLPILRRELAGLQATIGAPSGSAVQLLRPGDVSNSSARFITVGE